MKKYLYYVAVLICVPSTVFASVQSNRVECFPKTDARIPATGVRPFGGISQNQFNEVLSAVNTVYAPIVSSKGGRLQINPNWNSGEINAFADRQGSTWIVDMHGGLARHSEVTISGFLAVACHEVGHHLGGAPLYTRPGNDWAATEGQSDYFATLKCMRKVLRVMNLEIFAKDDRIRAECARSFTDENEVRICEISTLGAQSLGRLSHALGSGGTRPDINTPDSRVVNVTFESHPQGQCRLDTGFQGALCTVSDSVETNRSNPNEGTCNRPEGFTDGVRPLCWYKPTGTGGGGGDDDDDGGPGNGIARTPTLNGQADLSWSNPWQPVTIQFDIREFQAQNPGGVYIEVSQPNRSFSNPNGNSADPSALGGISIGGLTGSFTFIPAREFPGWGVYQIRVIPLDQSGQNAVGRFSNPSSLRLLQQRRFGRGIARR